MTDSILAASRWLSQSNITETNPLSPGFGGVRQAYNHQTREYTYVYSEITGYAISAWVDAYRKNGDSACLALAERAAQFLVGLQTSSSDPRFDGGVPHGLGLPDYALRPAYYSFDNAMILQGLLDLYRLRPSAALLDAARRIGDWLVDSMQQPDGSFLAVRIADPAFHLPEIASAFGDGGSLHGKHAIGLLKLYQASGDDHYAAAARRLCDWLLTLQDADGALQSTRAREKVVTHTHCYAVEGLLYAAHALDEPRYHSAAQAGADWLLRAQNRDGSLSIDYKQRWWRMGRRALEKLFPRKVSDATAQAMRLWLILAQGDTRSRQIAAAQRAGVFLRSLQIHSTTDPNADGGLVYWAGHPMQFAWCTMFAIQALAWLEGLPAPEEQIEALF